MVALPLDRFLRIVSRIAAAVWFARHRYVPRAALCESLHRLPVCIEGLCEALWPAHGRGIDGKAGRLSTASVSRDIEAREG